MPDPQVQNKMTFSGDYGMDKWVLYDSGSVSVPSFDVRVANIPHSLGYTPLVYGQWSESSDFSTPREVPQNAGDQFSNQEPWVIGVEATDVAVFFSFQNSGLSSKTFYYRVWGLPQASINVAVETTSTTSGLSPFVFNGEQNYLKPYMEGDITVTSSPVSVVHGLGYVPVCMVWYELSGAISPRYSPVIYDPSGTFPVLYNITDNELVFRTDFGTAKYHYKIYLEPIHA